MTVQDIVNSVSLDTRTMLQSAGTDASTISDWVDRIHKDCLRDSIYHNLNRGSESVTIAANTSTYTLVSPSIRQVSLVYDRTTNRFLDRYEDVVIIGNQQPPIDVKKKLTLTSRSAQPEIFKFSAPSTLVLFPTPLASASFDVHFEKLVATVDDSLSAVLIVPDDGKDMLVAGVNYLANAYLGREQAEAFWLQLYVQLKRGVPIGVGGGQS